MYVYTRLPDVVGIGEFAGGSLAILCSAVLPVRSGQSAGNFTSRGREAFRLPRVTFLRHRLYDRRSIRAEISYLYVRACGRESGYVGGEATRETRLVTYDNSNEMD